MWEHVPRWRVGNADPPAAGSGSGIGAFVPASVPAFVRPVRILSPQFFRVAGVWGLDLHRLFGWRSFACYSNVRGFCRKNSEKAL